MISAISHCKIRQRASNVFVEPDVPALSRRIVELLTPPFTWSVYLDAPVLFMVFHSDS